MYSFDPTNLKIVTYRRKSSEDEERQVASLGDQATALEEVAARLRVQRSQIAAEFAESRSAKLSQTRPEFQRMLEMINRGEANAILTWHPDRLSRNLGDVDSLVRLMENRKLTAIITPQYMFGNAPLEKYILISECTRAKLENDNKGVNVKRGLAGKVRKGWRPGVAKFGYLNNTERESGERDISPDPERFDKVRRLLRLFLSGKYSVRQIRDLANQQLLLRTRRTKRQGGKPLSLSAVYYLLSDPFYCGKFWWKNQETGERELYAGKHRAMISEDEFWQIQALLGRGFTQRPKNHLFAYTALMTCGECGAAITAEEKWQIICGVCKKKFASQNRDKCPKCGTKVADMGSRTVLHYVYYHCTKKKGPCSQKWVRLEDLESDIDRTLARFTIGEKYARWAVDTLARQGSDDRDARVQIEREKKREESKLKEDLAELNRFIVKQESAGWTLMSKEEALAEKQRLLSQMKTVATGTAGGEFGSDGVDQLVGSLEYACYARLWLREGTLDQKREVFSALGSNLTLKDKKVNFCLNYPLPQIERMIEIAPEIIARFEPKEKAGNTRGICPSPPKIPALLRGLNDVRTYFATTGKLFWNPKHVYAPSIRTRPRDA